ncbi:MAG: hypothetical protein MJZ00_08430 [Paludibacteraceae bacterium]|nr:hypothetical protein [Paludibacteraceae bacterium]
MCAAITIQELSKIDDPYPITTADEFAEAFVVYNEYGSSTTPFCLSISNDIDMATLSEGKTFRPLDKARQAKVLFKGNNHTISNLTFVSEQSSYSGLFTVFGKGSELSDITFENIDVVLSGKYAGVLVSYINDDSNIYNCKITGKATYTSEIANCLGGLAGYAKASGTTSIHDIIIDMEYVLPDDAVGFGGVIGGCNTPKSEFYNIKNQSKGTVNINCSNTTSTFGAGGIFGYFIKNESIDIHDCENYLNIKNMSSNVGGIVGLCDIGEISNLPKLYNCTNAGNIESTFGNIGGIIGKCNIIDVSQCVNIGKVTCDNPNAGGDGSEAGVGGICGFFYADNLTQATSVLYSCINMGFVSSNKPGNIAGIVGYYTSKDNTYNQGIQTSNIFPFKNCLSITNDAVNRMVGKFMFNNSPSFNRIGGLYADSTLGVGATSDSIHYVSNSRLISGKLPLYYYSSSISYLLDNEKAEELKFTPAFSQKEGHYPYVNINSDIAKLASLPIIISDNECLDSIASGFNVTVDHDVVWTSEKGKFTVSSEGVVSILGQGEDYITGTIGNAKIRRRIFLYKNVFGGGRGTADDPYLLKNITHFEELNDSLQKPGWSREKHFRIAANISGLTFPLSTTRETAFMGELDGDGYSVKMDINSTDGNAAMFIFAEKAYIHDLQTSGKITAKDKASSICATAYTCFLDKCYNSAKISGNTAGGVVAYAQGGAYVGLCNSGSISGTTNAGGIIGNAVDMDEESFITDCVNSGYVKGAYAGGIVGPTEKICANFIFYRVINYGSVYGTTVAYPYAYTTQTGFGYIDSRFDIQITKNGHCKTESFIDGATYGPDIEIAATDDITFERYSDDPNAAFIPSFVKKMKNAELLGILPTFENEELTSNIQTTPSLLASGTLILKKLGDDTEHTSIADLLSNKDVQALLIQRSATGEEKEIYINITGIPFATGEGSAENPYLIESISDIQSLVNLVEENKVTDSYYITSKKNNWSYNKHFKLTKDILGDGTASSIVTSPIASENNPFQGVFDGGGHSIKVSLNNQDKNYQALFASIESGAEIKNLIVTGVASGVMCVSGVVASATSERGSVKPIISNVINNVNVEASSDNIGGVCGKSDALIENCVNAGKISIKERSTPYHVGGVVGTTSNDVYKCVNIGNVYGYRRVGGICGSTSNESTKGLVKNCINAGMVHSSCPANAEYAWLGGLIGSSHNFEIESSLNLNSVNGNNQSSADALVGSITGTLVSSTPITNCYYDKQLSSITSENGTGLLTSEISSLDIEGFDKNEGNYPSIANPLSAEKVALLTASSLQLFENEDKSVYDIASKLMNYGDIKLANPNIKWTSKNGVVAIESQANGLAVHPKNVGMDTLIITLGEFSKEIAVKVFCVPVRVDTTITGCQMVSVLKSDGTEIICTNDTTFTEVYNRENTICDSTIKYTVKINKITDYKIDTVLCAKNALDGAVYRGYNYTNTEVITTKDTIGCDSAITTNLRVVIPRTDSIYTRSGCDSVFCDVDGRFHYETTAFTDTIRAKGCGCDSVYISVSLQVFKSAKSLKDEVYLDSFLVSGKMLKGGDEAVIYDTLTARNGCDSIVEKHIYVYDRKFKMDTVIYACNFYLDNINYKKITHDTILIEQLSETLHGIEIPGYYLQKRDVRITHSSAADTVRMPDEYYCQSYMLTENIGGVDHVLGFITSDTVIKKLIPRERRCDSVQIRTIHILPAPVKDTINIVNCGDYYDATLDTTFTSTQDYEIRRKFNSSKCDCDSSITLRRYEIRSTKYNNISVSGCSEAEYTFYGNTEPTKFTTSTDTTEVIRYTSGPICDSIINRIHISVANPIYDTISKSTCGDTIMYNGRVYLAKDGDYKETITYRSKAGCDSLIRFLDFRFVETIENRLPTKYGCDSAVCDINNNKYFENHTISIETGKTEQGCPIFTVQDIVVLHPDSTYLNIMGCEFAEFNGQIYYSDTSLTLPLKSTLCDCDSFVFVKIRVLPRIESETIYLSDCDSVTINDPENGIIVLKEDVDDYQCFYQKVHYIAGKEYICDSIVHYNVHVNKPTYSSVTYTGESTVVYEGVVYRRNQTIRDTLINAEGCDSFVEINIVVEKDLGYPVIVDKFGYTLFCNNNIGNVKFATYQWYKDGIAIPGATKEYYEEAKGNKLNGCYQVEVTSDTGREYASEIYCVDKGRELKLYPNPISPNESLTIDYPFTDEEKKHLLVEIYDANGIMINDIVPSSYPIHLEAPSIPGHYFILILESNERMLDARFIVR